MAAPHFRCSDATSDCLRQRGEWSVRGPSRPFFTRGDSKRVLTVLGQRILLDVIGATVIGGTSLSWRARAKSFGQCSARFFVDLDR